MLPSFESIDAFQFNDSAAAGGFVGIFVLFCIICLAGFVLLQSWKVALLPRKFVIAPIGYAHVAFLAMVFSNLAYYRVYDVAGAVVFGIVILIQIWFIGAAATFPLVYLSVNPNIRIFEAATFVTALADIVAPTLFIFQGCAWSKSPTAKCVPGYFYVVEVARQVFWVLTAITIRRKLIAETKTIDHHMPASEKA